LVGVLDDWIRGMGSKRGLGFLLNFEVVELLIGIRRFMRLLV
jgi:hypothetical protein